MNIKGSPRGEIENWIERGKEDLKVENAFRRYEATGLSKTFYFFNLLL